MRAPGFRLRSLSLAACASLTLAGLLPAPAGASMTAYPDIGNFTSVTNREIYRVVDKWGIWFTSPLGYLCGIADDGSYGCTGALKGVPAGENEAAWFYGDPFPRLYLSADPRFDSGAGQTLLVRYNFIEYRGSRCAVTPDSAVYCIHGDDPNSQLLVTSGEVLRGAEGQPSL